MTPYLTALASVDEDEAPAVTPEPARWPPKATDIREEAAQGTADDAEKFKQMLMDLMLTAMGCHHARNRDHGEMGEAGWS